MQRCFWQVLKRKGIRTTLSAPLSSLFDFEETADASMTESALSVSAPMSGICTPSFTYDAASGLYKKGQYGGDHIDETTGEAVRVKNVFLMYTDVSLMSDGLHKEINLASGHGYYFTNGKMQKVTFRKADEQSPVKVLAADGSECRVTPGQTWFCVIPSEFEAKACDKRRRRSLNNRVLPKQKQYSTGEEILNSISHGAGAIFAACGTALLIVLAAFFSDAWGIVSSAVYGFSLIVLYTMSTLYHAITNARAKRVMRVLDHSSIFLLIAGTYTPISLVTLRGPLGWVVFGLVWGSAVIGIVFNAVSIERFKKLSLILYIASGWAVVIAAKPMIVTMRPGGLWLLLIGGLFYTGGIFFYVQKKRRWFHGIWHLFVLFGSVAHYLSILFYVILWKKLIVYHFC